MGEGLGWGADPLESGGGGRLFTCLLDTIYAQPCVVPEHTNNCLSREDMFVFGRETAKLASTSDRAEMMLRAICELCSTPRECGDPKIINSPGMVAVPAPVE